MAEQPVKGKCSGRERFIVAAQGLVEQHLSMILRLTISLKRRIYLVQLSITILAAAKKSYGAELIHRGVLSTIHTQDTQQTIIEAAVRVFARSGVSAATLDDIATEADGDQGSIVLAFP